MKLSLVIPCFNEEAGIAGTVDRLETWYRTTAPEEVSALEIVLIDDGSTDRTREILDALAETHPEIEFRVDGFPMNRGRGAGLRRGFRLSTGDIVVALDADLSYDEDHITRILATFREKPLTDVVVVSAYMKGGRNEGVPWNRLFVSRVANKVLAGFLHQSIRTVTCVVRGYRGDLIRSIPLFHEGKGIHLEILRTCILRGARLEEIPGSLVWNQKETGGKRRKTNLRFFNAAGSHFLYAFLVQPTRLFGLAALLLSGVAVWEVVMIGRSARMHWGAGDAWTGRLWTGLSGAFDYSPHSFFIFGISAVLGFQFAMFAVLLAVMRFQHTESLQYLMGIWAEQHKAAETGNDSP